MKQRLLALFLCLTLLLPVFAVLSAAVEEEESPTPMAAFAPEHIDGKVLRDDGTIGIPVELNTYIKDGDAKSATEDTPSIFYVIGTNTERIGTDSDEAILRDLLDEGYLVTVVDYRSHEKAVSPALDWSLQALRHDAVENGKYLGGAEHHPIQSYILPAGYRIVRDLEYFDLAADGNSAVLDWIVKIWNEDFTDRLGETDMIDKSGNACKVKDIIAETVDDCRNKDGSPLDLKLRMDFIYPSNPTHDVPVMCLSSSSEDRNGNWMNPVRPHMTGFLFAGYAGVTWDHVYVPMARYDHYGYFEDTQNYDAHTLQRLIGVKAQTAAVRFVRYTANANHTEYRFDLDRFGAFGMSKGGYVYLLGNKNPESFSELWDLSGDGDETVVAPRWSTYTGGALDGEAIPSGVQMVYAAVGNGEEWCSEGFAPTFTSQGEDDGDVSVLSFMERLRSNSRTYDTPWLGFTMPDVGHTLIYGYSKKYCVDMYAALFDFANYYLQNANAVCEYITPVDGTADVPTDGKIEIKFTGPVSRREIEEKVRVIDTVSGSDVTGSWDCELGRTSWTFTPHDMRGGVEIIVYVPRELLAENGKSLAAAKAVRLTTVPESVTDASDVFSTSGDMTLTRGEGDATGVMIVLPVTDLSDSTSESLRFSVTNDAYNRVAVYAVTDYNEEDPAASVRGEKLGTVNIGGRGEYRFDVGDYLATLPTGARAVFYLEVEKTVGESLVLTQDFEQDYLFRTPKYTSMTSAENHTAGGGKSAATTYFSESMILFPYGLTEEDFGRRFRVSLWCKPTADRLVVARIRTTAHARSTYVDPHDTTYTLCPDLTVGEWNEITFDYRIDDPDYVKAGIQKVGLFVTKSGAGLNGNRQTLDTADATVDTEVMYIDDIRLYEIVTEVQIALSVTDGARPGLVTHPSEKRTSAASGAFGIGNGEESDKTSDSLIVSGRATSEKNALYKKVYAKLDLAAYDPETSASVTIRVKDTKFANLLVFGVSDIAEAADWSADSMSWYSAPANERSGALVDTDKVYGGAPIAKIAVLGTGLYTVNVTEYVRAMCAAGGSVGTLIFVSDTQPGAEVITDEDFNDYVVDFDISRAGDAKEALISAAENYPDGEGYSYKFLSAKNYDRVKFDVARFRDMTRADIGRRFRVTYFLKADKTGSFTNMIVNRPETFGDMQVERKTYDTAGVWQEYTYDFEVTDKLIFADTTGTILGSYFGICPDKMGTRATGGEEDVTLYIDNIRVVELSGDDVAFEFVGGKSLTSFGYVREGVDGTVTEDFGATSAVTTIPASTSDGPTSSWALTRVGLSDFTIQPASWANHTADGAKAGVYTSKVPSADAAILFYNLLTPYYGDTLTEFDIGRRVEVSFWFRSRQTGTFDLTVSNVTRVAEKSYAPTTTERIDTAWTWKEYTYAFTVTAEMVREGAALLCLRLNGFADYSGATSTECNLDDITATTSPAEADTLLPIRYEDFSKYVPAGTNASAAWPTENVDDALNAAYGVVWAGTGSQTVNYIAGQGWADHSATLGGTSKAGLQFYGQLTSSQIKFYNMITPVSGNALTEADIGRSFRFSFWLRGEQTGSFRIAVTSKSQGANTFTVKSEPQTVDKANTWKNYSYEFTVTEQMVKNSAALPTIFLDDGWDRTSKAHIYIDDLLCYELPRESVDPLYRYSEDFEQMTAVEWANANGPLHPTRALTYGGFESVAGAGVSLVKETEENQVVRIHTNKVYNRLMLYNVVSPLYRTENTGVQGSALSSEDLGRQFLVTFRLKAGQTGTFDISLTAYATGDTSYVEKEKLSYTTPGEWQTFSYLVTVNRAMIEKNAGLVTLTFSGFGQNANGSEFVDIFLDDVASKEFAASASCRVPVSEATAVANGETDGTLSVDRTTAGEETLFGIRKVYLAFADLNGTNANRAELTLRIAEAEGQTLKIYGLPKALSDSVTWNTAPANLYHEGIDEAGVYLKKPLTTLTAAAGEHRIDVTEYVRAMGGFAAFAVVTEDAGGTEFLHADFSSVSLSPGVDYITDDTMTLSEGVGKVTGKSVTFRNVFGGRDAVVREGQEYRITLRVLADGERDFTLSVDGTDAAVRATTSDGTLTLRCTATAADVLAGVSSLTVTADRAGFTLDELVVADTSFVRIEEATLAVYEAIRPTLSAADFAAKSNITLASDFGYNAYFRVAPGLSIASDGVTTDMTSPEIVTLDGVAYVKIRRDLAPKDGTDAFSLTVNFDAAEGVKHGVYTLSIPKYAAKIIGDTTDAYDETTKALMRDILSYISSAMTYFDTSTDEKQQTITSIVGEGYHGSLTAESVGLTEEKKAASDSGNALSSVCLNLEATPSFVFYLKEGKESLATSFRFASEKGAPLTVEVKKEMSGAGRTYLEVRTYAYAMGDTLTFTYTDEAGNKQNGSYNLAAYYLGIDPEEAGITAERKAKREALQTLTIRLAQYANSAAAYRDSVIEKEGN